jgi:hypothetical protein
MAGEWFCRIAGNQRGPLSAAQLKLLATHGELRAQDLVRQGTDGPWVPAERVKGLFSGSAPKHPLPVAKPLAEGLPKPSVPEPPPVQSGLRSPPTIELVIDRRDSPTVPSIQIAPAVQALAKHAAQQRQARNRQTAAMIVLGIVAVALGVAGYVLWRQGAPPEERPVVPAAKIIAAAKKPPTSEPKKTTPAPAPAPVAKPKPIVEVKWRNAAEEVRFPAQEVAVKVQSVSVGKLPAELGVATGPGNDANKKYLILVVNVHNLSAAKKLDFQAWGRVSRSSSRITLVDDVPNNYRLFAVQASLPSVYPGEVYSDTLIFEPPVSAAKYLRVTLPTSAFGGNETLNLEIPKAMITTEPESPKPAPQPAAPPVEPAPTTVPAAASAAAPAMPTPEAKPTVTDMPGLATDAAKPAATAVPAAKHDEIAHPSPIDLSQPVDVKLKKKGPTRK